MPPQYQYEPIEKPRKSWGSMIFWVLGIALFILLIWFFVIKPLTQIKTGTDEFFNESVDRQDDRPQEIIDMFGNDAVPGCGEDFYNCGDFETQGGAQYVFDYCIGQGAGDIHGLDGDGNGKACENLA